MYTCRTIVLVGPREEPPGYEYTRPATGSSEADRRASLSGMPTACGLLESLMGLFRQHSLIGTGMPLPVLQCTILCIMIGNLSTG